MCVYTFLGSVVHLYLTCMHRIAAASHSNQNFPLVTIVLHHMILIISFTHKVRAAQHIQWTCLTVGQHSAAAACLSKSRTCISAFPTLLCPRLKPSGAHMPFQSSKSMRTMVRLPVPATEMRDGAGGQSECYTNSPNRFCASSGDELNLAARMSTSV